MSTGIDPIDSAPLIIRTYNDDSADNTFLLTRYDYPVSSNYVLRTSANGALAPSDALTQTTMGMSSMTIFNHFGSTMVYDTFSSVTLFLPSGVFDTIEKTTMLVSSVTASTIFLNVLNICTMNASTFSPNGVTVAYTTLGSTVQTSSMTYSTLIGDSLFVNTGFISTLFGSSIYAKSVFTATTASDTSRLSTLVMDSTIVGFLSFSTLQGSTLVLSTLSGSTIYANSLTVSTLDGGLLITSTISCTTLSASSLYASGLVFSTTTGSLMVMSTVSAPLLFSNLLSFSTAQGSTVTASNVTVSSLYTSLLVGSTIQSNTLIFSTLIGSSINTSELIYSTAQGSTMLASTIDVSTLVVGVVSYSTLLGSSITVHTLPLLTLTGSTISWNRVVLSTLQGSNAIISSVSVSTLVNGAAIAAGIQGSTILVSTAIGSSLNTNYFSASTIVSDSLFFSTLSVSTLVSGSAVYSTLQGSTATLSTLTASTLSILTTSVSTLNGSTVSGSTLTTSSIQSNGIVFSTLQGSTLLLSTLTSCTINTRTISVSTLQGSTVTVSTLTGSTIVSGQLAYSTLIGSTIVTDYITANSTFTYAGTQFISSFTFSTQQTSAAFLSTLVVTSTLTVSTLNRINPTSTTLSTLTLSGGLEANTATGLLVCSSLTVNTMNLSRSIVNQPVYGNSVKTDSVVASGWSVVRTSGIRGTIDQMPTLPQTYTFGQATLNRWVAAANTTNNVLSYSNDGFNWVGVGSTILGNGRIAIWNGSMWVAVGDSGAISPAKSGITTNTWTHNSVTWTATASATLSGWSNYFAFDGSLGSDNNAWAAATNNYNSAGTYVGAVTTTVNGIPSGVSFPSPSSGSSVAGDWLQLQSSTPLTILSYTWGSANIANQSKSFCLVGSNDGTTWYFIQYVIYPSSPCTTGYVAISTPLFAYYTGAQMVTGNVSVNATTVSSTYRDSAYTYFRMIGIQNIAGTNGASNTYFETGEWSITFARNTIAYSYDGIKWTGVGANIFTNYGLEVAWSGSMWVAVGGGTNSIAYSYDGINWSGLGTGILSTYGHAIAWNGMMWVATGLGSDTLAYSCDGINWVGLGVTIFSGGAFGVAWNGTMWIAVGQGGNTVAYSYNGINWIGLGNILFTSGTGVAWNGTMWVVVGGGTNAIAYSYDGINWIGEGTQNTVATRYLRFEYGDASVNRYLQIAEVRVYTAAGINIITPSTTVTASFVNIGYPASNVVDGNNSTIYHSDFVTSPWLEIDLGSNQDVYKVEFVNRPDCCRGRIAGARMVLKNTAGTVVYTSNLMTLKDNITTAYQESAGNEGYLYYTWFPGTSAISYGSDSTPFMFETSVFSSARRLAWNGNMWLATGVGINNLAYSYNGINWFGLGNILGAGSTGMSVYFNSARPHRITFPIPMTVATGSGTNTLAYSSDGINWTGSGLGIFSANGAGVATNGSMWVATGSGTNTLAYSTADIETPYIHLPFENGLYSDVMGNSTITATGSPAFVTGPIGSKAVNLINTAGSSTGSQYLDGNCTLGANFSVSLWFKFNTLPATDSTLSSIITLGSSSTMSFQLIYLTLAGYTGFYVQYVQSGGAAASIVGKISVSAGIWYQCTVVFQSAGICSVYLNNTFVGSNPGGGLYTPITNLRIGYNLAGGVSAFNGYVDDVRIYNYAITVNPRITWRGLGTSVFSTQGKGVAWNGTMWIAVGSGTNSIAYSYDGVTWIGLGLLVLTQGNSVAWNGSMWVAVGSGTNSIAYSYNGISWSGSSFYNTQWNGVAWNGSMWIAVGSGPNIMAYSYNGINWSSLSAIFIPSSYLPFENSIVDTFGNLTSPTMVGSVTYSSSIRKIGTYSTYFNNTPGNYAPTNYLDYLTPTSFHNPTAFTVSFWMYHTAQNMLYAAVPVSFNNATGNSGLYFFATDYGITVYYSTTTSSNGGMFYATTNTYLTWTHVAFTFGIVNGSGIGTLYVNGVAQSTRTTGGTGGLCMDNNSSPLTRLNIGCQTQWTGAYAGYVDDVRIYTSTLPPSLIAAVYNSTSLSSYLSETTPFFTTSGNGVAWNGVRWVAVGSGGNTIVYSTNGIIWTPAASSCFTTAGNGVTWNGARWLATGVGTIGIGYSSDGSTWTGGIVQNINNTISPQLTGLVTYTWIQNGVAWATSSSSVYSTLYAYGAFNTVNSPVGTYSWASNVSTYSTIAPFACASGVSTTIQGVGSVVGEWLQLQSSTPLIMRSYTYGCGGFPNIPQKYYIVGSNDGSTWYPIQYASMTTNPLIANFTVCSTSIIVNQSGPQTIIGGQTGSGIFTTYPTTTNAYSYFRILATNVFGAGSLFELGEWYINFGSPFVFNTFDPSRYYYHYTLYAGATVTASSYKLYTPSITLASASSQYLQTANFTPTTAGLSFAFWYKSNASGSWARIFDFGNGPANNVILCSINGGNANYLYFEDFYATVPTNVTLSDINYNDNTWRHVVWTLSYAAAGSNTSTWNIYINGTLKTTGTSKSYPNPAVTRTISYIGRSNWSADFYYNGNIDDFRIYNAVLTAPQVTTIYSGSVYDSTYNTTFSTAGSGIASNTSLSGTVVIQHPVVAVGQGTHSLAYSPDGVQWTGLGTALFTTGYCVAWNGTKWMVGGLGTNTLAYSYDGVRWTGLGSTVFSTQTNGIAWNGSLWIAVGSGLNTIAYSTDGLSWTGINNTNFTSCNAVAWNGKQWVAVGTGTNSIAYSADGITWTAISSTIFSTQGNGVAWTGSLWVAVGTGTNTIAYSSDGLTWTPSPTGNAIFTDSANSVAWNGTRWVAVGAGASHTIAYSANGTVWTGFGKTIFSTAGNGVCWTGTRFVAVGNGAMIGYSQDGLTWYASPSSIFSTYGNGVAGNPRIGATVSDSQVALSDSLDMVSDTYYNTGYTNFSATIQSQTYAVDKSSVAMVIKMLAGAPTNVSGALYPAGAPVGARVSFTYPTNTGGGVDAYYASAIDVGGVQPTVITPSPSQPIIILGLVPGTTYRFQVYSSNSAGQSAPAVSASNLLFQVRPSVPQNYSVALDPPANPTGIVVSFTAPATSGGITNYTVTPSFGSAQTGTALSYTFTGFTPGSVYTFSGSGTNTGGTGAIASSSITYYTKPDAPTVSSITLDPPATPTGVNVAFSTNGGTGGGALMYVAIAYDSNLAVVSSATGSASPLKITGLTAGTSYTYRIVASNVAVPVIVSDASTASAATTYYTQPVAPTSVSAVLTPSSAPTGVNVSFTPPSNTIANTGGATLSYIATAYSGVTAIASSTSGSSSPLSITGLTAGVSYTYSVVSSNGFVSSAASTTSAPLVYYTKPTAPTSVSAALHPTTTPNGVNVSFTSSSNNGGGTLTYTATAYLGGVATAFTASGATSPLKITGLTAGTTYTYSVTAANAAIISNISDPPATLLYQTNPSVPQSVNAVVTPNTTTISWSAPSSNGGTAITSYQVVSSPAGYNSGVLSSSTASVIATGLTNGTSYTFTVTVTNGGGLTSSATTSAVTPYTTPSAPTGLSAVSGSGQVTLNWTAPSNGGRAISGYKIINTTTSTTITTSSTSYTWTGLTINVSYSFTVAATNDGVNYGPTSSVTGIPYGVPSATNISSTSQGFKSVTLNWTAPANNSSPITSYDVSSNNGASWISVGNVLSYTFGGLSGGTYTLRARAVNAAGAGPSGTSGSQTLPAAPSSSPSINTVSTQCNTDSQGGGDTYLYPSSTVTWGTTTGATGYKLYRANTGEILYDGGGTSAYVDWYNYGYYDTCAVEENLYVVAYNNGGNAPNGANHYFLYN